MPQASDPFFTIFIPCSCCVFMSFPLAALLVVMQAYDPAVLQQLGNARQGLLTQNWAPTTRTANVRSASPASSRNLISEEAFGRANASLFAAVIGDSLSLTTHYEYDSAKIRKSYAGEMSPVKLLPPGWLTGGKTNTPGLAHKQWHPGKNAGDLTDYGDYTVMTMEFVAGELSAGNVGFDTEAYHEHWRNWIMRYTGYINFATKETLTRMREGGIMNAGSPSVSDLAPVARVPPLLFLFGSSGRAADEDRLAEAARAASSVTHRAALAQSAAEFFARATHKVISRRMVPSEAIERTIDQMESRDSSGAGEWAPSVIIDPDPYNYRTTV
jgi:ADP-ribosylglycohydrolase